MGKKAKFASEESGFLNLRSGTFTMPDGRRLETPYFFPIVNIMTGPPGPYRNGGLFRHIKMGLLQEERIPGFMAQILHFTEFNISSKTLTKWLSRPVQKWIDSESNYEPFVFSDSGGYRLLYNSHLDLERFDMTPDVASILGLQIRFGGDFLATLDYPILPTLSDSETKERQKRSRRNSLETLRLAQELGITDRIVFPVVHGRSRRETQKEVTTLLLEISKQNLEDQPLGIAIGSLVPLSSSPARALEIIRGVRLGLESVDFIDPDRIPVHAFGVSTSLMPFSAMLGVDTFDGSTYVQSAQNLRYFKPGRFSSTMFLNLKQLDCSCKWCSRIREGGLEQAKNVIRGKSYSKHEFAGRKIVKSELYAMIALHNLENVFQQVEVIREAAKSSNHIEQLFLEVSKSRKSPQMLHVILKSFPEMKRDVRSLSRLVLSEGRKPKPFRKRSKEASLDPLQRTLEAVTDETLIEKSLELGPDDFNIMKMEYSPCKRDFMILLPCTQTKPYRLSTWHKTVSRRIEQAGITRDQYEKVTMSGNYGPIPESHEEAPEVLRYEFHLHSSDVKRIRLLANRTTRFLEKYGSRFANVIGYCTSLAYREAMRLAFEEYPKAVLLPSKPRARRASQFLKEENLKELTDHIRESIRE